MDDPASINALAGIASEVSSTATDPISAFTVILYLLLVLFLVAANGFFVASEFALVAVRKSRIEAAAAEGDKKAIHLLGMLNNLNAYISATQLGITLSSLGLGWVGEPMVASLLEPVLIYIGTEANISFLTNPTLLHTVSFIIAFSVITFLHIVYGELAPKTAALEISEGVSYAIAKPLQLFYRLFYYPIRVLDWAGVKTVRAFGLKPSSDHSSSYTEDEIRQLIIRSEETGHLNKEERILIDHVFDFSETTVKEAMVPRIEVVGVSVESTFEELFEAFQTHGYSRLPVYGESLDDMIGIVHLKDVIKYLMNSKEEFSFEAVLQKPVYVVNTAHLEDVLRQMQLQQFHFGFVVDEHGGIEGIITLEDLLEEIVGEISDEHDEEVNEQIQEQEDGTYVLDGGLAVRDLNKRFGFDVSPTEGYTTLAGFLMSIAGELLEEGQTVDYEGHEFRVDKVDKRRILQVTLKLRAEDTTEEFFED